MLRRRCSLASMGPAVSDHHGDVQRQQDRSKAEWKVFPLGRLSAAAAAWGWRMLGCKKRKEASEHSGVLAPGACRGTCVGLSDGVLSRVLDEDQGKSSTFPRSR